MVRSFWCYFRITWSTQGIILLTILFPTTLTLHLWSLCHRLATACGVLPLLGCPRRHQLRMSPQAPVLFSRPGGLRNTGQRPWWVSLHPPLCSVLAWNLAVEDGSEGVDVSLYHDPAQGWLCDRICTGLVLVLTSGFHPARQKSDCSAACQSQALRVHLTASGWASGRTSLLQHWSTDRVKCTLRFKGQLSDFTEKWGPRKCTFTSSAFRGFGSQLFYWSPLLNNPQFNTVINEKSAALINHMNIYTALCKIHLLTYWVLYVPVPCLVISVFLFTYYWGGRGDTDPFLGSSELQWIICVKTLFCQAAKSFALILKITINEC